MPCSSGLSNNQAEFPAEINTHFPGSDNLTKPSAWLVSTVLVCLAWALQNFRSPQPNLRCLRAVLRNCVLNSGRE